MTIERVIADVRERPHGSKLLVTGDFRADLSNPEGSELDKDVAAALAALTAVAAAVLEDVLVQFLPRQIPWVSDRRI